MATYRQHQYRTALAAVETGTNDERNEALKNLRLLLMEDASHELILIKLARYMVESEPPGVKQDAR